MITQIANNETLAAARTYAAAGISTIPIQSGTKRPAVKWSEFQRRHPSQSELVTWFSSGQYEIAVVTGTVSAGLAIRDFDQPEAYDRWAARYGVLAHDLPTVQTGKGYHVWCRTEAPGDAGSGSIATGDGEFRAGSGCYTLCPPSGHPSGAKYRWRRPFSGELPLVDPVAAGLLPGHLNRCSTDAYPPVVSLHTEDTENTGILSRRKSLGRGGGEGVLALVEATAPTETGERNRQLFRFARELKSIPEFSDLPASELEPYFRLWHEKALQVMQPDSHCRNFYAHLAEFERAFENVKHSVGDEPIRQIMEAALACDPPDCARQFEDEKLIGFVAFLKELQRRTPTRAFYLDCRTAGTLFGVCHKTAWNWLDLLARRNIVRCVKRGTRGRASEFRYRGD